MRTTTRILTACCLLGMIALVPMASASFGASVTYSGAPTVACIIGPTGIGNHAWSVTVSTTGCNATVAYENRSIHAICAPHDLGPAFQPRVGVDHGCDAYVIL